MSNNQQLKRRKNLKLALLYTVTTFSVVLTVVFMIFFMLGYRFDANNGQIEQYALLQLNSVPTGATVQVDGIELSSKTPCKTSLPAGKHQITIKKNGYEQWQKSVEVESGTMTWLDYAMLMPSKLNSETIAEFGSIYASLASLDGRNMIIQEKSSDSQFTLADFSTDSVKTTKLSLLSDIISTSVDPLKNNYVIHRWDVNGRYVLVRHNFDDKFEWIVMDTQDSTRSKNISKVFGVSIEDMDFLGVGGTTFYALNNGDIRKINLTEGTMSKTIVSNVKQFDLEHKTNTIVYLSKDASGAVEIGSYRDGDSKYYAIRSVKGVDVIEIASSHYFNEDYLAIRYADKVELLRGSYPRSQSDANNSLKSIKTIAITSTRGLQFSPSGQYIIAHSSGSYISYDLEYNRMYNATAPGSGDNYKFGWLNDDYLWSDRGGKLFVFEFDGANSHQIADVVADQTVSLSNNDRFMYYFIKSESGYRLQRSNLSVN